MRLSYHHLYKQCVYSKGAIIGPLYSSNNQIRSNIFPRNVCSQKDGFSKKGGSSNSKIFPVTNNHEQIVFPS